MHTRVRQGWILPALGIALAGSAACNDRTADRNVEAGARSSPIAGATAESPVETPGWITTKIQSQYFVNSDIRPSNIEVTTTSGGVVTLRGEVGSERDRAEAIRIARETEGVTRVEDLLRIHGDGETAPTTGTGTPAATAGAPIATRGDEPSDLWITTKVQAKYYTDDEIPGRSIDVHTQGGIVTLKGTVDTYSARRQAVALARNTDGVREVRDELRVEATEETGQTAARQVDDTWLLTKIQSKYFLDPDVKGRDIDVAVEGGAVTLTGSVETDAQKETAERIARETEGVQDVRNQIEVRAAPAAQ